MGGNKPESTFSAFFLLLCGLQVTAKTVIRLGDVLNFPAYTHLYSTLQLLLARQPLPPAFLSGPLTQIGPCGPGPCTALCCSRGRHFSSHRFSLYSLKQNLPRWWMLIFSLSRYDLCCTLTGWTQVDGVGWASVKVPLEREGFPGRWGGDHLCYLQCCGSIGRMKLEEGPSHLFPCISLSHPGPSAWWCQGTGQGGCFQRGCCSLPSPCLAADFYAKWVWNDDRTELTCRWHR